MGKEEAVEGKREGNEGEVVERRGEEWEGSRGGRQLGPKLAESRLGSLECGHDSLLADHRPLTVLRLRCINVNNLTIPRTLNHRKPFCFSGKRYEINVAIPRKTLTDYKAIPFLIFSCTVRLNERPRQAPGAGCAG